MRRISQFAWCVLSPDDFKTFWKVEMESDYRAELNPGGDWTIYVEARDQRGHAVSSSTAAFEGVLEDGPADEAAHGLALMVALDLAEKAVAEGYLVPASPQGCVVRVPVPREYRAAA